MISTMNTGTVKTSEMFCVRADERRRVDRRPRAGRANADRSTRTTRRRRTASITHARLPKASACVQSRPVPVYLPTVKYEATCCGLHDVLVQGDDDQTTRT